jgi:hypothetical protein
MNDNAMTELRNAIRAAAKQRFESQGAFAGDEIIEELLAADRDLVVAGLDAIVGEEVDRLNDEDTTEEFLVRYPLDPQLVDLYRMVSETLHLPLWYLLSRQRNIGEEARKASLFIQNTRIGEKQARMDALKQAVDRIEPICKDHPKITAGEAERLLRQETERAIDKLEESNPE